MINISNKTRSVKKRSCCQRIFFAAGNLLAGLLILLGFIFVSLPTGSGSGTPSSASYPALCIRAAASEVDGDVNEENNGSDDRSGEQSASSDSENGSEEDSGSDGEAASGQEVGNGLAGSSDDSDDIYTEPDPEDSPGSDSVDTYTEPDPEDSSGDDPVDIYTGSDPEVSSGGDPLDTFTGPQDDLPLNEHREAEESYVYTWPESGIVTRIPVPDYIFEDLWINDEMPDQFFANATVPISFFEHYLNICKGMGYAYDVTESSSSIEDYISYRFQAYDSEGYCLGLDYTGSSDMGTGTMDFFVRAPRTLGTLVWPDQGPGLLLPLPPTTVGSVGGMPQMFLIMYLGNMPIDLYHSYIEECKAAGFNLNSSQTDTTYSAVDQDGIQLSASYDGGGIVFLKILDPEQKWIARIQGALEENGDGSGIVNGDPETSGSIIVHDGEGTSSESKTLSSNKEKKTINTKDSNTEKKTVKTKDSNTEKKTVKTKDSNTEKKTVKTEKSIDTDKSRQNTVRKTNKAQIIKTESTKNAWLIQASALQGRLSKKTQSGISASGEFRSPSSRSETNPAVSRQGDHSRKAAAGLTGLLSICIIMAGAIYRKKAFVRSLQLDDRKQMRLK